MKLGVISDIHGDPDALERAWANLKARGADAVVCAGDLVGYGPFPDRAVAFLAERQVPCVRGNHDRWALERDPGAVDPYGGGTPGAATLDILRGLQPAEVLAFAARVVVVVHGSPRDDMEFVNRSTHPPRVLEGWLRTLGADVLIVGHTHRPMAFSCSAGLLVNPGAVVSAAAVESSRSFALIELATLGVTFHEVETGNEKTVERWS